MSTFIHKDGKFISFTDFLSEAFSLVPTSYGNNVPDYDNKYIADNGRDYWTFTKVDDVYIMLILQKNLIGYSEIGFGSSLVPSTDMDDFTEERLNRNKALKIFNSLLYIFLQIIKKSNVDSLFFNPADERLGKFYEAMVKNKSFLKALDDAGYVKTDETFTFKKK